MCADNRGLATDTGEAWVEGDGRGGACCCRTGSRDAAVYWLSLDAMVDAGPEELGGIEELILAVFD